MMRELRILIVLAACTVCGSYTLESVRDPVSHRLDVPAQVIHHQQQHNELSEANVKSVISSIKNSPSHSLTKVN